MKNLNKHFMILALLLAAGALCAAGAKPVFSEKSIVCGNKTVTWEQDGKIIIRNKSGQPEAGITTCYPDKHNKGFRFVLQSNSKKSCTFTIDLCGGTAKR